MTEEALCEVHWDLRQERPADILSDVDIRSAVAAGLVHGGRAAIAVEVILVDDTRLTDLHARFLNDPTPTDVITFDLGEEEPGTVGEIYVSVDCARRVATQRGVRVERELALYLVHGALHLCGYDDHGDEERARMRAAESLVMATLGYEADKQPHELD